VDSSGHIFVSYVHEDSDQVDLVDKALRASGIAVWRDKDSLWPGDDWRIRIREAISSRALVMVACFSSTSVGRDKSYMNEELALAVDKIRQRPPGKTWLLPIRLDDCNLPEYDLGGGRTLDPLHRVDLFGARGDVALARLVAAIVRLLPSGADDDQSPAVHSPAAPVLTPRRTVLRAQDADIEVEGRLIDLADHVRTHVIDTDGFPIEGLSFPDEPALVRELVRRVQDMFAAEHDLIEALIAVGQWGRTEHMQAVSLAMGRLGRVAAPAPGTTIFAEVCRFALLPAIYAATMASWNRSNYPMLHAVLDVPRIRVLDGTLPLVAATNVYWGFSNAEVGAQAVAFAVDQVDLSDELIAALRTGRQGKRYTPISDALATMLRPYFMHALLDDAD
jgi:hypothetical protein